MCKIWGDGDMVEVVVGVGPIAVTAIAGGSAFVVSYHF